MTPAPIILFCYNRAEHLRRTIEALAANALAKESPLVVFSDGPRGSDDAEAVASVRAMLPGIDGFKSVDVYEAPNNRGLAASVIAGVSQVLERYPAAIVMEDDIIAAPHFLDFMNEGLATFAETAEIASVGGYMEPLGDLPSSVLLRKGTSWGWGTWARAWHEIEWDGQALLSALAGSKRESALDFGSGVGFSDMLRAQVRGENDSWAIRFYVSSFLANRLHLLPGQSLVSNIGHDGSGSHCSDSSDWDTNVALGRLGVDATAAIEETQAAAQSLARHYQSLYGSKKSKAFLAAREVAKRFARRR